MLQVILYPSTGFGQAPQNEVKNMSPLSIGITTLSYVVEKFN